MPGFQIQGGKCDTKCTSGIFSVVDNSCLSCSKYCLLCDSINQPKCTRCMTGYFINNN